MAKDDRKCSNKGTHGTLKSSNAVQLGTSILAFTITTKYTDLYKIKYALVYIYFLPYKSILLLDKYIPNSMYSIFSSKIKVGSLLSTQILR